MRVALIEDCESERNALADHLTRYGDERHRPITVEPFATTDAFTSAYVPGWFNLLVLDCYLDNGSTGLKVARELRAHGESCPIVFATNSPDFAVEGFEVNACASLLKPVSYEKLCAALDRALSGADLPQLARLDLQGKRVMLDMNKLLYVKSDGHYVEIFGTGDQTKRLRANFKDVQGALEPFGQTYSPARGLLVNFEHVVRLEGLDFVLDDGTRVPISKQNASAARTAYANFMFGKLRKG